MSGNDILARSTFLNHNFIAERARLYCKAIQWLFIINNYDRILPFFNPNTRPLNNSPNTSTEFRPICQNIFPNIIIVLILEMPNKGSIGINKKVIDRKSVV